MSNTARPKLTVSELCPDELLRGQEEAFALDIARLQSRLHEFVQANCPACNSSDGQNIFEKHMFQYQECRQCSTVYMNPRPSVEVMGQFYADSENYKYWAKYIFPASEADRREKINKPWLARVEQFCDKYSVLRDTIMEAGGGFGTFAQLVKDSGSFRRVVVVEPNPDMAASCQARGLEVINAPVEAFSADGPIADVMVAFEVVEHLFEPRQFFLKAHELLRAGGLLVVSCPNSKGFDIMTLGAQSLAVDPEHVNLFNPTSLTHLVESSGFDVLEISTPGRLDAEFVRRAILSGNYDVDNQPFLKAVLVDQWDKLGGSFQDFLADAGLSSHMWLVARNR